MVDEIIRNERSYQENQQQNNNTNVENVQPSEERVNITLNLPYAGNNGHTIISKVKKYVTQEINKHDEKVNVSVVYNAKKLGSKFNIKDQTKLEHKHNVVYHTKCPNKECKSHYGGQTKCRIGKRALQHNKLDKNSHLLKHANQTKHTRVWLKDFKIIGSGYKSDFKRRISESLHIKKLKQDLNIQKDAYKLSLFN